MAKIKHFEDLEIWQLARQLCKEIHKLVKETDLKNDHGLRNQIKNSSGSVMDNIAEGFERGGNRELIQFLSIAKGSCGEARSQITRCYDFEYLGKSKFEELRKECIILGAKIHNLIDYLKSSDIKGIKYKT